MSTKIRLSRAGTKKRPVYRVVVTSSRSPRDSKIIERIGTYNPLLKDSDGQRFTIDEARVRYWLEKGAQPSDRVHIFLFKAGIMKTRPAHKPARPSRKNKGGEGEASAAGAEAPAAA
jgi:small subunit ribosomal protein S16